MEQAKKIFHLLKDAIGEWSEDKASRLAAALAYYTLFSIPAVLLIALAVVSRLLGDASRLQVERQILATIPSSEAADVIAGIIENASEPSGGIIATIVGLVTLVLTASAVFAQLHEAMNNIWEVEADPTEGIIGKIKDRLTAFAAVVGLGGLLILSLVATTAFSVLEPLFNLLPGSALLQQAISYLISLVIVTVAVAALFRVLPDVTIDWSDVWIGAGVTAVLFILGQIGLGFYLGQSATGSSFGAAGGLVVFLLWVYYSFNIFFLGAEITQVYANTYGSHIRPEEDAVSLRRHVARVQAQPHEEPAQPGGAPGEGETNQADQRGRQPRQPRPGHGTLPVAPVGAGRRYVQRDSAGQLVGDRRRWSLRDVLIGSAALLLTLRKRTSDRSQRERHRTS